MHLISHYRHSIATSFTSLLAHKGRSFLTMLGIIIGVGAVIVIMAVGAGAQSLILSQVKSFGTNLIGVLPGASEESGPPASAMGIAITTLTYEDAMALGEKSNVPNIVSVAAYYSDVGTLSWGANTYDTSILGTTASYTDVEGGEVANGRFFTKEEETNLSRVIVLGKTVKQELFGDSDAVGQTVKYKKHTFEVIGVMAEKGTVLFQNYDDMAFIPIKTMQKIIAGVNHIGFLRAKVDNEVDVPTALQDIKITLRERHEIKDQTGAADDFTVRSVAQALDMITTITNALRFFLAAIAAISLLVGGIGIMNIMLVRVTERTREIGLRKALGANNSDIMTQFLVEAISITLLGGLIGIAGGIALSFLIAVVARLLGYDWGFSISIVSIILAVGVSSLVGLVFGLYPARRASKLEPVEALRYE